jgi:dolichol-phosphate mannosyltransferase
VFAQGNTKDNLMKVIVTIPTYNERKNIGELIQGILSLDKGIEVIVADDDSPDGTWEVVQNIALKNPAVHLLHRKENRGRGNAGKEAFQFALNQGVDLIIEMDGDLSHHPRFIPSLIEGINQFDVVIGSRYVEGGKDLRTSLLRRAISRLSNWYARKILGLPVLDCNSGFRCFKKKVFEVVNPLYLRSTGPSIIHELLYKAYKQGFSVGEVPIEFYERGKEKSKLTIGRLLRGWFMILKIRWGLV